MLTTGFKRLADPADLADSEICLHEFAQIFDAPLVAQSVEQFQPVVYLLARSPDADVARHLAVTLVGLVSFLGHLKILADAHTVGGDGQRPGKGKASVFIASDFRVDQRHHRQRLAGLGVVPANGVGVLFESGERVSQADIEQVLSCLRGVLSGVDAFSHAGVKHSLLQRDFEITTSRPVLRLGQLGGAHKIRSFNQRLGPAELDLPFCCFCFCRRGSGFAVIDQRALRSQLGAVQVADVAVDLGGFCFAAALGPAQLRQQIVDRRQPALDERFKASRICFGQVLPKLFVSCSVAQEVSDHLAAQFGAFKQLLNTLLACVAFQVSQLFGGHEILEIRSLAFFGHVVKHAVNLIDKILRRRISQTCCGLSFCDLLDRMLELVKRCSLNTSLGVDHVHIGNLANRHAVDGARA